MSGRVLMVQGASSSVGKSWLVTALCRIYARRGLRVAPFKAQNMSNNAAVCADGAEIGRAQAVQALAAGIEPSADMNPVLLKPEADSRSQVIVQGRPWRTLAAGAFYKRKNELWQVVTAALARLRAQYELVIIEGAGSPAELNLQAGDIVNMAVARHARAPVLLVGDIDRGGVFAQLLGTLWLLSPEEQALVRGFVVNKFRGDPALFVKGVRILEERSQRPVLGVAPYVPGLIIPTEDAASMPAASQANALADLLDIAVIHLPHIANFDDVDPLRATPDVHVRFVTSPQDLGDPDAIILPGSKSTVADLRWLAQTGLAEAITRKAAQGAAVVGLCGGYQMLGQVIRDPEHVETTEDETLGLGLLPIQTTFDREKATYQVRARIIHGRGWLAALAGEEVRGYEIHMGRTESPAPWLQIVARNGRGVSAPDGAMSEAGRVWGCYLHGIFENDALRRTWLGAVRGWRRKSSPITMAPTVDAQAQVQRSLDRWAAVVEAALDMEKLDSIIWEENP